MYRDELSRKDLKFKLKAQSLGIGAGDSSTGGPSILWPNYFYSEENEFPSSVPISQDWKLQDLLVFVGTDSYSRPRLIHIIITNSDLTDSGSYTVLENGFRISCEIDEDTGEWMLSVFAEFA